MCPPFFNVSVVFKKGRCGVKNKKLKKKLFLTKKNHNFVHFLIRTYFNNINGRKQLN